MNNRTIVLIGAGAIINSHVEALKLVDGYQVVAVCDLDRELADKVAREFVGCEVFTDYRRALERQPKIVVVALPHSLHCRISCEALRAGCHVVVEKPMAVSPGECREMLETAHETGKTLYVSESASFKKGPQLTGRKLSEGLLGRFFTGCVIDSRGYSFDTRPAWGMSVKGSGGGLFANVGVHRLAIARCCLPGMVPRTVSGWVSHLPQYEIEACTSGLVKYDGGGAMHYENTGYFGSAPFGKTTHFIFEEGIVSWEEGKWMIFNESKGGLREEPIGPDEPPYVPVYRQITRILNGDTEYLPKAYEYAVDTSIAHALYASSKAGKEINILEPPWDLTDLRYL